MHSSAQSPSSKSNVVHNDTEDNKKTCCSFYGNNREAYGWCLDIVARGMIIMANVVFTNTALLRLARIAAGCQSELEEGQLKLPECTKTVYGIRPSSLLTTLMTAIGFCSALLMPIIGATIDHTEYRRAAGRISAIIMTAVSFCQIFISQQTWFFISICQVLSAFFYIVHTLVALAYLPELTNDTLLLTKWTGSYTCIQYSIMTVFLIVVVICQLFFGLGDVHLARLAQSISFVICLIFYVYSWFFCFEARPALSKVPENQYLIFAGFRKLCNTGKTLVAKNISIKYFLISLAFTEAAVSSFGTISVTFMSSKLQFSSIQNGIAIFCLLIGSVPGSWLSIKTAQKWCPVRSFQLALFLWILNTIVFSFVVKGPEQDYYSYGFAFIWGIATGWTYPMERLIYCTIIPKGQEAELMGVYTCTSTILSWLPSLVFTAMNEAGISMNISFACLSIFFLISILCLVNVARDYDNAVKKVNAGEDALTDESLEIEI